MKRSTVRYLTLCTAAAVALTTGCGLDDPALTANDEAHLDGPGASLPDPVGNLRIERAAVRQLLVAFDDNSTNETGFIVERYDFGTWVAVANLPATPGTGTTSSYDDHVDSEQRYCYRVRVLSTLGMQVTPLVCGRTLPAEFDAPNPSSRPAIWRIDHPAPGALGVIFVDNSDAQEWTIYLRKRTVLMRDWVVRDHRPDRGPYIAARVDDLDPGDIYCFTVSNGSKVSKRLCASPSGARTDASQRDPEPAHLESVAPTSSNNQLRIVLSDPHASYTLERNVGAERETVLFDMTDSSLVDDYLAANTRYCYRVWVRNRFGTRYSNRLCGTPTSNPPGRPGNFRITSNENGLVRFAWDGVPYATDYELHYHGERQAWQDDDDNKTTSGTSISFEPNAFYTYCFKVRARNEYGLSDWSSEICGIAGPSSETVNYLSFLEVDVPYEGYVIFWDVVDPLGTPQPHLVSVDVVGNSFTNYLVRFLPPGSTREACGGSTGVVVEPGHALTGGDLAQLYGSATPATPITLLACKLPRAGATTNLDHIPIGITYRR